MKKSSVGKHLEIDPKSKVFQKWVIRDADTKEIFCEISVDSYANDGTGGAKTAEKKALAILRAVNVHEQMLDALIYAQATLVANGWTPSKVIADAILKAKEGLKP